jgi:hypothetical protein
MIGVKCIIELLEIDGKDVPSGVTKNVSMKSHWNYRGYNGKVVLVIGKKSYTFYANDLEEAIEKCR